jgi:hypothetical protein
MRRVTAFVRRRPDGRGFAVCHIQHAQALGANPGHLESVTHTPKSRKALDLYTSIPWSSKCVAVACLRVPGDDEPTALARALLGGWRRRERARTTAFLLPRVSPLLYGTRCPDFGVHRLDVDGEGEKISDEISAAGGDPRRASQVWALGSCAPDRACRPEATRSSPKLPLDVMEHRGRLCVLDGLHRLARAVVEGREVVAVRKVPRAVLPLIRR